MAMHQEYYAQFWTLHFKNDPEKLEQFQRMAIKTIIRRLENKLVKKV